MLAYFAALLLLSSISFLCLDLIELAQIYFFLLLRRQERLEVFFPLLPHQEVSNCMMV